MTNTKPNGNGCRCGEQTKVTPWARAAWSAQTLSDKEQALKDLSFTLEFLAYVARLVEEAREADPQGKGDLSYLAGKVMDNLASVFETLKAQTWALSEDLENIKNELDTAILDLVAKTNRAQKPSSEDKEAVTKRKPLV